MYTIPSSTIYHLNISYYDIIYHNVYIIYTHTHSISPPSHHLPHPIFLFLGRRAKAWGLRKLQLFGKPPRAGQGRTYSKASPSPRILIWGYFGWSFPDGNFQQLGNFPDFLIFLDFQCETWEENMKGSL